MIKLNSFNSFTDNQGKIVNFTGSEASLSIDSVMQFTDLRFYNFSKLTIIAERISKFISLFHVKNCIFQLGNDETENIIKYVEIGQNDHTEIKSNVYLV